jgi:hypothetical protein
MHTDKKAGLRQGSPAKLVGGTPTLEAGTGRERRSASNKADHAQEIRLRIIALCHFAQTPPLNFREKPDEACIELGRAVPEHHVFAEELALGRHGLRLTPFRHHLAPILPAEEQNGALGA